MLFNYLKQETYMDSINIDNIGECCLEAINDDAEAWYLCISSHLGWTTVIQFGPIEIDSDDTLDYVSYSKTSYEFNHKKIYNVISDFINNPRRMITQLFEIDKDTLEEKKEIIKRNL